MAVKVTIDNVKKNFGATKVLDGVSLEIEPGSLTFLLGSSGCGKTTLLRIIAGLTGVSSGRVAFDDQDVTSMSPRERQIGMVFQSYALWPHMTVRQNVEFGLKARRADPASRTPRVNEILDAVGLGQHADRKPAQLSGGQQQRVALARALVVKPRLLLLDEPLSNLDAGLRVQLRELIRDLVKEAGITSIYVTHDQDEAMSVADEIVVMKGGGILQRGAPREIYNRPQTVDIATFMGETNLIDATLLHVNGQVNLNTPIGQLVASEWPTAIGHDALATVAIRPESFRITDPGASRSNAFTGSVHHSSRRGLWSRHVVKTDSGHELVALEPGLGTIAPGDRCCLEVDAEHVVVLPSSDAGAPGVVKA
ncbi:MAG: ABC transporter ATP-binding protein [Phycisphaeraceae bacterium]|nr:ABC transporter ATP-binding protein [Phycisphaeraceae bacterium]MCB9848386.1 ABC transporter ATP-binding protein [Phycisphaeraceae bacterium]